MAIEISDAKQAYLKWNEKSLERVLREYEPAQQSALGVIPLLLQINHRLLPGYNGPNTASGIYGYQPSKRVIDTAKQINNRFIHDQQAPLKNTIIESVFLQRGAIDARLTLWVIHTDNIKPEKLSDLDDKVQRIAIWLKNRGLVITAHLVTVDKFCSRAMKQFSGKINDCALALDYFYYESFLMAGKYPVWWLVPPDKETTYADFVEHIRQARFVNENEYIDLGGIATVNPSDIASAAIGQVCAVYQRPEIVWLNLLLLDIRQNALPDVDGLAWRLKVMLYEAAAQEAQADESRVLMAIIRDALDSYPDDLRLMPLKRVLSQVERNVNPSVRWIFQRLLPQKVEQPLMLRPESLDVVRYLNLFKALLAEIRTVFEALVSRFDLAISEDNDKKLSATAHQLLTFLTDTEARVPLYNVYYKPDMVLDRIVIKHEGSKGDRDIWALVVEQDDEQEKIIQGFDSLLALLCWTWLNRIVDQGTQVSIHCPMRLVKQIEARHVLEILISRINPVALINKPKEIFRKEAKPVSSSLFLSVLVDEEVRQRIESMVDVADPLNYIEDSSDLVTHCEQLVINSWGDVYVRHYRGSDGMLQCLCDWLNTVPANVLENNEALTAYGYASGISTFMAQRIIQIYGELREFVAKHKGNDCRFIVSLGQNYYCLESYDGMWRVLHIGNMAALYPFLEKANKAFKPLGMDRHVLATTPLRQIAEKSRAEMFQVFFQVSPRYCDTWVLDDKGSLFYYRHAWFDRNSFVAHWLYLVRNIRNRLKKISYQGKELPTLEIQQIGINRTGGYVFYPVGAESVKMERNFIDVQVSVITDEEGDLLSLRCDGQNFDYTQYQNNVVNKCVEYIKHRIDEEDRLPIYVTDIQAPLRLFGVEQREDIQLVHFLKYKRNIENRLNQLVYG